MWKVKFLGIDENGYRFLKELKDDLFSSETHDINSGVLIEHYVHVTGHDGEETTKILEIAENELKIYVALWRLNGYEGTLKVDHPCKINPDGSKTIYAFLEDKIYITDSFEVSTNGEVVYSSYQGKIKNNKEILEKALESESKKELLILLGYEQNWINAYKIYEILKNKFKSESYLKQYDALKYFAHSANSPEAIGIDNARHAVQSHQNPKKIADMEPKGDVLDIFSFH